MKNNNALLSTAFILLFLTGIFFFSIVPLRDFDIWFHVKSGELILQQGIMHHDVFSYNTAGREWFPYEWLFQIGVASIQAWFGFEAIKYVIAFFVTAFMALYLAILRRIIRLPTVWSIIVSFLFWVSTFEYISARPHIVAYTFFIATLYLILLYVVRDKNKLYLTLPITLLWANMHGSIFLDLVLFGGYTVVTLLQKARRKAITLAIYTGITALLTILPPLGTLQYRLLIIFYQQNALLSKFIDEWTPLATNQFSFIFYSISLGIVFTGFLVSLIRKKTITPLLLTFPIIIFPVLPYTASRNIFLGYITLGILVAYTIQLWIKEKLLLWVRLLVMATTVAVLFYHIRILADKRVPRKMYYPVKAVQFLKTHVLNGHMFNEYGYGGYLLYQLYPQYQVFYDGRTDLYISREMPDTLDLAFHKNDADGDYKKRLDSLWNTYNISFVLLRTQKHTMLRKIQRILTNDPAWVLVFWDDYSQLFVRRDGKNDGIIAAYGALYATPYDKSPIRGSTTAEALAEYIRMQGIADSGHTRNAIGYIYLTQQRYDEAKKEFEQAVELDPSFESPLMNLAELAAKDNDLSTALALYENAYRLAPDRGLIYIRLGQLLLEQTGDTNRVRDIWEDGVKNTVDTDAKQKLQELLHTL